MHRVLAAIDRHLDEPLDLATLAGVACFSPFHFHRLFTAWTGETVGEYLRRRRLEVAAMRLATQPRTRVLDVALGVGFGSAEAFTRAFRGRFGTSPSAWRANEVAARRAQKSKPGQVESKRSQASEPRAVDNVSSMQRPQETPMKIRIVDRQDTSIVYLRRIGPYGEQISDFWQNVYYPWALAAGLLDRARYGISYDDPAITAPEKCRYDAGADIGSDAGTEFVPHGGAERLTLPGGRYAVLDFRGRSDEIVEGWARLLRDWLPESGLQLDGRPFFEHYPTTAGYDPATGIFECELCIPVAPL